VTASPALMARLSGLYPTLSPQLKRAAKYVLDNPTEIAILSMRQVAGKAEVGPNTMIRLTRALDFTRYEDFREPFRQALRVSSGAFPDRARSLQSIAGASSSAELVSRLAAANLDNLERAFHNTGVVELQATADRFRKARQVYVLGLGSCFSLAYYFYYVARMALPQLVLLRGHAGLLFDELSDMGKGDLLFALSLAPYTRDTVKVAGFAKERGAAIVTLTDSLASPLAPGAVQVLIAPTASPQFFPSLVASAALVEALAALVVARGGAKVIENISKADRLREQLGVYWSETLEGGKKGKPGPSKKSNAN